MPGQGQVSLATVLREWGRIGCIGFGGPPTHIALLRQLCVDRRQWLDAQEFEDAIGACNLLPGPASTELAIFCAWRVRGRLGALAGGLAFILPGLVCILALSALFLAGTPPLWVQGPAPGRAPRWRRSRSRPAGRWPGPAGRAPARTVRAAGSAGWPTCWPAGPRPRPSARGWSWSCSAAGSPSWPSGRRGAPGQGPTGQGAAPNAAAVGDTAGSDTAGSDTAGSDTAGSDTAGRDTAGGTAAGGKVPGIMVLSPLAAPVRAAAAVAGGGVLVSVAWVAFKVGALSFGGGFVIIPLMRADAVGRHWMTSGQFLNAVALGQITPGPVVLTVSAVGYAAAGVAGALLAALVAFSPSFAFVLGGARYFSALRTSRRAQSFLDGAGPAAIGAILGSAILLAEALSQPWQYAVLAGAAVLLLGLRRGVVFTLLAAAATGLGVALASGPLPH